MPEGEALWERLTAQNTELSLLRVQAAAHKDALATSDRAAAEAKEAAAQAMEHGAASAKKAADLVALLHLKEVQYTKVRAERDAEHAAKAAAVQALAASKLASECCHLLSMILILFCCHIVYMLFLIGRHSTSQVHSCLVQHINRSQLHGVTGFVLDCHMCDCCCCQLHFLCSCS